MHPLEAARTRLHDFKLIFSIPAFATYQAGNIVMNVGFWMQRVAIGWVTWELTGSEFWLGIVAFAELFPSIFTAIYGGIAVDRYPAPLVMFWGQIAGAFIAFLMAALHATSLLTPYVIVVVMALMGAVAGVLLPARLAMASYLAPTELLPQALAINSTVFNLSRFLGPALAAVLLATGSATTVFVVSTLGFLILSIALFKIRDIPAQNPRKLQTQSSSTLQVIKDLWRTPTILAVIAIQVSQGLFLRPASELFPAYSDVAFAMGATGLGLLNTALGIGAIIGALALSKSREPVAAVKQILIMSCLFAISLTAFSLTGNFTLALVILVFHGAFMSSSNIAALAYVQIETPTDRLGRVLSLYTIVFRVTPAIGALLFGLCADLINLTLTGVLFSLLGLASIVVIGLWALKKA